MAGGYVSKSKEVADMCRRSHLSRLLLQRMTNLPKLGTMHKTLNVVTTESESDEAGSTLQ